MVVNCPRITLNEFDGLDDGVTSIRVDGASEDKYLIIFLKIILRLVIIREFNDTGAVGEHKGNCLVLGSSGIGPIRLDGYFYDRIIAVINRKVGDPGVGVVNNIGGGKAGR